MGNSNKKAKNKNPKNERAISGSLKDQTIRRKQIFKPILENPFTQSKLWPFIDPKLAENIIDIICVLLSNVGNYNTLNANSNKGLKREAVPQPPKLVDQITVGFNPTVKALEDQGRYIRHVLKKHKHAILNNNVSPDGYIKYVLVAKYDIDQPLLTDPFPILSFTASRTLEDRVKLVQLPRGFMKKLSDVLKIDNVGIIGLKEGTEGAKPLFDLIDKNVTDVRIPWLECILKGDDVPNELHLQGPTVKFLSTSAPILPKKNDQKKRKAQDKVQQKADR